MSKKKKKIKQEKIRTHDFKHLSNSKNLTPEKNEETIGKVSRDINKNIDKNYILDLKKVLFFIGLFVILIAIISVLVYKTQVFSFIFTKFNIKY